MNKFKFYVEDITRPEYCDYEAALNIYKDDKLLARYVYGFSDKIDMQYVEVIANDILRTIQEEE